MDPNTAKSNSDVMETDSILNSLIRPSKLGEVSRSNSLFSLGSASIAGSMLSLDAENALLASSQERLTQVLPPPSSDTPLVTGVTTEKSGALTYVKAFKLPGSKLQRLRKELQNGVIHLTAKQKLVDEILSKVRENPSKTGGVKVSCNASTSSGKRNRSHNNSVEDDDHKRCKLIDSYKNVLLGKMIA
jgi:hypothetical protein